ncbi:MAG TPA: tetratricopeptide repeat protein [Candidatus Limnocylindria bacterium]|nr:tetratricopeptide repeat protein [Candidatus Limnocylindria bacterium]
MRDVDGMLADVRALAHRGDHHAIVSRYGTLDDTPEDETWNATELLWEIGKAFGMLGNEEKVERYLLRCAELAPRRAAVFHCAIGWYFQRKKKWAKALRWYDRALQSFPTYHLCLFRRGYCLEKLHRPREAMEAFRRARAVWEQAGSEQRLRGRGVQVQVLFHLSRVLRDLGHFEEAGAALDACTSLDAGCSPPAIRVEHLRACQGELSLRQGDLDAALAWFREACRLDPHSSYIWERIGRTHELRGEIAEAQAAYEHAIGLPRGAFAYLALGRLHLNVHGDLAGAANALVQALRQLHGVEPLVRLELARLHRLCGRPNAALTQLDLALASRRDGTFLDALRLAADLAEETGDPQRALGYVAQLERAMPDDADLAGRRARLQAATPRPAPPDAALPPELAILDDAALADIGRGPQEGVVDRFFAEKGFGFVRYGDGESLFFHVTQLCDATGPITPGTRVSFIVGHNPKKGKPQAEQVRLLDEA